MASPGLKVAEMSMEGEKEGEKKKGVERGGRKEGERREREGREKEVEGVGLGGRGWGAIVQSIHYYYWLTDFVAQEAK